MNPLYTEVFTLKISSTQKRTLEKLKSRNIKVSDFESEEILEMCNKKHREMFNLEVHYKKETVKEDETGNNLKVVNE